MVHAARQQLLPRTALDAEMDAALARREVAREQRRTSERRESGGRLLGLASEQSRLAAPRDQHARHLQCEFRRFADKLERQKAQP